MTGEGQRSVEGRSRLCGPDREEGRVERPRCLTHSDPGSARLLLTNAQTRTCTRVCSPQIPFCQELKVLKYLLMDRTFPLIPASLPCGPAPSPVLANEQAALEHWGNTVLMLSVLLLVGFPTSPAPPIHPNNANDLSLGPSLPQALMINPG